MLEKHIELTATGIASDFHEVPYWSPREPKLGGKNSKYKNSILIVEKYLLTDLLTLLKIVRIFMYDNMLHYLIVGNEEMIWSNCRFSLIHQAFVLKG